MTIQLKILIGMKVAQNDKVGLYINPFYNGDVQLVKDNFEEAKKIYKDLLPSFISAYVIRWCFDKKIILNTSFKTVIEDSDRILKAVNDGEISPIPGYQELRELVI